MQTCGTEGRNLSLRTCSESTRATTSSSSRRTAASTSRSDDSWSGPRGRSRTPTEGPITPDRLVGPMAASGMGAQDVEEVLEVLRDADSEERDLALVVLSAHAPGLPEPVRDEVLDHALDLTRHPRRRVRMQALLSLGFPGLVPEPRRAAVVDRLLELFREDRQPAVRDLAAWLLRTLPDLVPEERRGAVGAALSTHPGHPTHPLSVEDPFTGELQTWEIDVDIADAVAAANEALKQAGLTLRTVSSCQGYTREADPPVYAGHIAFDSPVDPGEFYKESQAAQPLLLEAAWRALQRSAEDGQVSLRVGFQRLRSPTEPGEEAFRHLTLSVCLYGRDLADPMRAVWAAFAEELRGLQAA